MSAQTDERHSPARTAPTAHVSPFIHGSPFAPARRSEIVGIDGVMAEVDEIIACLRHADTFARHGATLEPGVLFEGAPGTGKTLAARYLATESEALFVNLDDVWPGRKVDSADLSRLFSEARAARREQERPVVLFWDEFDLAEEQAGPKPLPRSALAARLAVELDGAQGRSEGLLLVACTNHAASIDRALLRPGRIGRRIRFYAPDYEGKALLLRHYLTARPTRGAFDYEGLARLFAPHQPAAEVAEAVAEGWRLAVQRSLGSGEEPLLEEPDLRDTLLDRLIGRPLTRDPRTADSRLRTAVHEVGHALVALDMGVPVTVVTVRPGREAAGQVITHGRIESIAEAQAYMRIALGGSAAEQVAGLERGVGNTYDTAEATRQAVMLADLVGLGSRSRYFNPGGLGRGPYRLREPSHELLWRLDEDALDLLDTAWEEAVAIVQAFGAEATLELARLVLERETMLGAEFARAVDATRRVASTGWPPANGASDQVDRAIA